MRSLAAACVQVRMNAAVCACVRVQSTLRHERDQVNIGMFHPYAGMGIVYGTRQGKVVSIRATHE